LKGFTGVFMQTAFKKEQTVRSAHGAEDSAGFMQDKVRAAKAVRAIGDPVRFEWIEGIHDLPLQRPTALAGRIRRFAPSFGR
jgi:hypothetical protein